MTSVALRLVPTSVVSGDDLEYGDHPDFNDRLDMDGEIEIAGETFRRSAILFQMAPEAYRIALTEYQEEIKEELNDFVCDEYPTPVAYCFRRFSRGYETDLQRFMFLRDTWESTIYLLHAVAVSEARFRKLKVAPEEKQLTLKKILSGGLKDRLDNIRRVFELATEQSLTLETATLVTIGCLDRIADLNGSRNIFSHSSAPSETVARQMVDDCVDEVIDILAELDNLRRLRIIRYHSLPSPGRLRVECFYGHGRTKEYDFLRVTPHQLSESQAYFKTDVLLAQVGVDGSLFPLRPFLHPRDSSSGHRSDVCIFKKPQGEAPSRELLFEIHGEGEFPLPRFDFQPDIDDLRSLFGLSPETA